MRAYFYTYQIPILGAGSKLPSLYFCLIKLFISCNAMRNGCYYILRIGLGAHFCLMKLDHITRLYYINQSQILIQEGPKLFGQLVKNIFSLHGSISLSHLKKNPKILMAISYFDPVRMAHELI